MTTEGHNLDPTHGIALFTDGSAWHVDRTGGWAWVALDAFEGTHASSGSWVDTTNNQMEMRAVIEGLYWLHEQFGPIDVLIYSDSEYVVLGMNDRTRSRKNNSGFWESLDEVTLLHNEVDFLHVYGHNGHQYNELADEMAGEARKSAN